MFLPCTAEPVWAFSEPVALLSRKWHVFQAIYDGHQPEYPGDFTSVEQTVDDVKEYDDIERYLKTYSDQTICNVFWSGNNYALPATPAGRGTKLTYWYGDDEKKERRSNICFIKRYFPQIRIRGIPKMAHVELVIVHPEEFCRYAEKFLIKQTDAKVGRNV